MHATVHPLQLTIFPHNTWKSLVLDRKKKWKKVEEKDTKVA